MPGPLDGIKILDFTTLLPGPYATMTLADLGADVLKVESPVRPDLLRFWPPLLHENLSAVYAYLNRGKRSIKLDLKNELAIAIIKELIKEYDVVIEQFRPGVMKRLGLDYAALKEANPALIYCAITGYGQTGPLVDRAGHDINYLSMAGAMSYTGRRDIGPVLPGIQIGDVACGAKDAVIGVLAGVISRNSNGKGQFIDVSMTDGIFALHTVTGIKALSSDEPVGFETELNNGGFLYDFYETSDREFMSVGCLEPQFFAAFCKAINREDLIPGGIEQRGKIREVKDEVRKIFKTKTRDEWTKIFAEYDACVEPVLSLSEAFNSDFAKERGVVVEVTTKSGTKLKQIANPIKFSDTKQAYECFGFELGEHSAEILKELGYSGSDIKKFEESGLFG